MKSKELLEQDLEMVSGGIVSNENEERTREYVFDKDSARKKPEEMDLSKFLQDRNHTRHTDDNINQD